MNATPPNPTTRAKRRYLLECTIAMVAYALVIVSSRLLLRGPCAQAPYASQIALALSPLIPVIFLFIAILRYLLAVDELMRQITITCLALAGGFTALLAVTYGLIEGDFLPKLSAWWTYAIFMLAWLLAYPFVRRHYL